MSSSYGLSIGHELANHVLMGLIMIKKYIKTFNIEYQPYGRMMKKFWVKHHLFRLGCLQDIYV